MRKIIAGVLFVACTSVFAHEGAHGPEQKLAPHGGVLRDGPSLMFELVKGADSIKVYPLTHEGKAIQAKAIEIDSKKTALTDAKKKAVKFTLTPEGDAFLVKFEKGSSYRYALTLVAKFEGKENKANWQIELGSE